MALPQLEHVFISRSFFSGASDHKFGDGGGGNGSGQIIEIPMLNTDNTPDNICKTISSARYRLTPPRREAKKNVNLNIFILNTLLLFL